MLGGAGNFRGIEFGRVVFGQDLSFRHGDRGVSEVLDGVKSAVLSGGRYEERMPVVAEWRERLMDDRRDA